MYTQVIFWTIGTLAGLAMICCLVGFCRASMRKKMVYFSLICVESPEKASDKIVKIAEAKQYPPSANRQSPPGQVA